MPKQKLKVFMSYSHEDEKMKTELDKALIMLKRSEKIDLWQDRELLAGQEWDKEIKDEFGDKKTVQKAMEEEIERLKQGIIKGRERLIYALDKAVYH